jgi:hypothetical protein
MTWFGKRPFTVVCFFWHEHFLFGLYGQVSIGCTVFCFIFLLLLIPIFLAVKLGRRDERSVSLLLERGSWLLLLIFLFPRFALGHGRLVFGQTWVALLNGTA